MNNCNFVYKHSLFLVKSKAEEEHVGKMDH